MAPNQAMLQALARQKAAQKTPTGLKSLAKPKDIQDAFDAELAAVSLAQYPGTFRPPAINDPQIDDYITGVYGPEKINLIRQASFRNAAPNLLKVLGTLPANPAQDTIDQYVVRRIYLDAKPIGEIKTELLNGTYTASNGAAITINNQLGNVADSLVDKYATEDAKQAEEEAKLKSSLLEGDKYYKAQLPHPNLKYGPRTNLAKGIIGIDTLPSPSVKNYINTEMQRVSQMRQTTPGVAPSSYMDPTAYVADVVAKKGQTPFKDEAIRRQALKGKNIK